MLKKIANPFMFSTSVILFFVITLFCSSELGPIKEKSLYLLAVSKKFFNVSALKDVSGFKTKAYLVAVCLKPILFAFA